MNKFKLITVMMFTVIGFCTTIEGKNYESLANKTVYQYFNEEYPESPELFTSSTDQESESAFEQDMEDLMVVEKKHHHWQFVYQTYGDELISLKFPISPSISKDNELVMTMATFKNVGYFLTSYLPAKQILNPGAFFKFALETFSEYPNTLGSHEMWGKNGNSYLQLKTVNLESGVTTRVRYIVTPRNLYVMETRYVHGASEEHSKFFDSFDLLQ